MKRLMGGILQAVGLLIAGTSGLCSIGFFLWALVTAMSEPSGGALGGLAGFLVMVLLIGGIPFGIGFGLFQWGRSLLREAAEQDV